MLNKTVNKKKKELKSIFEKVLEYDKKIGLLIPVKWKYPSLNRKRNYIAVIIGLHKVYEFERIFCEPEIFELDENEERKIKIGFNKSLFKEDLIIEEKYSYKESKTFVSRVNYFEITILPDGIYGIKINKTEIKDRLQLKQEHIYERFKDIITDFGEAFVLYSMESVLRQKKAILKEKNFSLLDGKFW